MASVHRRRHQTSPYWTAYWRDETGRLHGRSTWVKDEAKARQIAAQYEAVSLKKRTLQQVERVIRELIEADDAEENPMAVIEKRGNYWYAVMHVNRQKIALSTKCRNGDEARRVANVWGEACALASEGRLTEEQCFGFMLALKMLPSIREATLLKSRVLFDRLLPLPGSNPGPVKRGRPRLPSNLRKWVKKVAVPQVAKAAVEGSEAHALSTYITGYVIAALEDVAASAQISANVRDMVKAKLEHARPIIARIWNLDVIRTKYELEMSRRNGADPAKLGGDDNENQEAGQEGQTQPGNQ